MGEGWVGVRLETGRALRRTSPLPNPSPSRGGAFGQRRSSSSFPRPRLRLGGGPGVGALDDLPNALGILAAEADEDRRPAFVMRRLPEGVGIGLLQQFDGVEIDGGAERRLFLASNIEEGAA